MIRPVTLTVGSTAWTCRRRTVSGWPGRICWQCDAAGRTMTVYGPLFIRELQAWMAAV